MAPQRRRTNSERRAETEQRLMEAASTVVARRGYRAASVEEITAEAGYSAGALYAHFRSKEELFLRLVKRHVDRQVARYDEAAAAPGTIAEQAQAVGDEWMHYLAAENDYFEVFISFWDHAMRDERLRPLLAERLSELRAAAARIVLRGSEARGIELDEEVAERLAIVITALGNGLALERRADPDAVPDDLFGTLLSDILIALAAQAERDAAAQAATADAEPSAVDA